VSRYTEASAMFCEEGLVPLLKPVKQNCDTIYLNEMKNYKQK